MKRNSNGKSGRELFAQAINKSIDMHVNNELNGTIANGKCSNNHRRIVKNILFGNGEKALPERKSLSRRTVAAILIAAILLLTGCAAAVIYHNEIAGFFETVFDNHTVVTTNENDGYPTTIEEIYEFTYIPEGYELISDMESKVVVNYTYKNNANYELILTQHPIDRWWFNVDNEKSYSIVQSIEDMDIYYQANEEWHKYMFKFDKYCISIDSQVIINQDEMLKIYNGINKK